MTNINNERRTLLQTGLLGGAVLSVGSISANLTGCSSKPPVAEGAFLRAEDRELFAVLVPVILKGALKPNQAVPEFVFTAIEATCLGLSKHLQGEVYKLLDLLHLGATRWLIAGVRPSWNEASVEDIESFLDGWRHSRVGLLNSGYRLLVKLGSIGFYAHESSRELTGYPGPQPWARAALWQ